MKVRMNKTDCVIALIASVSLALVIVFAFSVMGQPALIIVSPLSVMVILVAVFEVYRRLDEKLSRNRQEQKSLRNREYQQIDALFSLMFTLKPRLPFPNMRDWAVSPDLVKKILEVILIQKPNLVIEAGSGVSTVVIAYCLRQIGVGKVVALEHDPKYAAINQDLLLFHGMEKVATIAYAPLKEFEINGEEWLWYDMDYLKIDRPIDLLVVDGPPGNIQKLARYPALPLLHRQLGTNSIIILDDGNRDDEKRIVCLWQEAFKDISSEFLDLEKGAYILYKNDPSNKG